MARWQAAPRAARWGAPGIAQALSSLGNVAFLLVAARTLTPAGLGEFSLAYAGVLLVSQLVRAALGEASIVYESNCAASDARGDPAATMLGAALTATPVTGVVSAGITFAATTSIASSVTVGLATLFVGLADTIRYTLLARQRVRRAIVFDLVWTGSGLFGLAALWQWGAISPAMLLMVWVASAALAIAIAASAVGRPDHPATALRAIRRNPHSWRLTVNEAIITGSSYLVLAVLGIAGGTADVGAVRAALLPYLWVQLTIAGLWLVVLSRRPDVDQLRSVTRRMSALILAGTVAALAAVLATPVDWGSRMLPDHWGSIRHLAVYAMLAYAALTVAELGVLQLKATAATSAVLTARLVGASATGVVTLAVLWWPSPELALVGITLGHAAVACAASRWRRARQ